MNSDRRHDENLQPGDEGAEAASAENANGAAAGASYESPRAEQAPDRADTGAAAGEDGGSGGRSEADELRDRYLRLAAEFDNYRKRTERERSEHTVRAQGNLVQSLLDAIDDLERVADFTPETTTVSALLEGVQMVERKLLRALESAGLERVEAHGAAFDPAHHEALMTADTEHPHEDDTVGEVFQKGYRFQGHLLRPARVQVRKHAG